MRILSTYCLGALLLGAAAVGRAGELEDGLQHYENGHYVRAEMHLLVAARTGDGRAAEILGFMYAYGPAMFPGVPLDTRSAASWLDIAARHGRPTARYMLCALRKRAAVGASTADHCFDWVAETGRPGRR
jgi:TPR repeat protein